MTQWIADLKYGWRVMARRKGLTAIAIGTLAIGIGASTAIFSVVYPVLFRAVPYAGGERVTMLWERRDGNTTNMGFATYEDVATQARSFERMAATSGFTATLTSDGEPRRLRGRRVTSGFFDVLGVQPQLGRDFRAEDDVRGGPPIIILSHALWQNQFGADPEILRKPIQLEGSSVEVIGVMPAEFEDVANPGVEFYLPLRYNQSLGSACRTCRHLRVIGRLREGVTVEAASQELAVLATNLRADHPTQYGDGGMVAESLADYLTRDVRPAMWAMLAAVLLVLLVASLNVSNILLARGASRRAEFTVRIALGADRARIIRQLMAESVLLAAIGGVLGVSLAFWGVKGLVTIAPATLPRLDAISVNGTALAFAFGLTSLVAMLFGLVPARRAVSTGLADGIRAGARQVVGSDRVLRVVVISEVALALVLLVSSGLLLRSMEQLLAVDAGFETTNLLTLRIDASASSLQSGAAVQQFYAESLEQLRSQPGVVAAAFTSQLPLSEDFDGAGVHLQTRPNLNPEDDPSAFRYVVTDGYFETMEIPLVRGRYLNAADAGDAVPVAVISAAFAEQHFAGLDPIGEHVRVGPADSGPWIQIVGIVGDVRQESLDRALPLGIYLPAAQSDAAFLSNSRSLVLRTNGDPVSLIGTVRSTIWGVNKDQPITRVATAEQLVARSTADRRFAMVLFQSFGVVALLLAAAGIYGVLVCVVTDRVRELGVRAAFGATAADLVVLVLKQGMTLTVVGVVAGLIAAVALTRGLTSMLFGVSALDLPTYVTGAASLMIVALLSCWVPAYRASRVDPMETLRSD